MNSAHVCKLLAGAIDPAIGKAALEEMRAAWVHNLVAVKPERTEPVLSMLCRDGRVPEGSTRPTFAMGPAVQQLKDAVQDIFMAELPELCEEQTEELPGPGRGQNFNTLTVNRNWAVPLHKDTGTRPGSIVALVVLKEGAVKCPTEIRFTAGPFAGPSASGSPDGEDAAVKQFELENGDVLLFQGADLEHGNMSGIEGDGERWAFVFYLG